MPFEFNCQRYTVEAEAGDTADVASSLEKMVAHATSPTFAKELEDKGVKIEEVKGTVDMSTPPPAPPPPSPSPPPALVLPPLPSPPPKEPKIVVGLRLQVEIEQLHSAHPT